MNTTTSPIPSPQRHVPKKRPTEQPKYPIIEKRYLKRGDLKHVATACEVNIATVSRVVRGLSENQLVIRHLERLQQQRSESAAAWASEMKALDTIRP